MVTSVCSCQTQLVSVMAVRYGGENKAALKHLIIPSVCLHAHLKGQEKKIIIIIDPCIDSQLQMTLYSPIHQRLCDNGAVLVFQRCFTLPSVWSLTEPLACTDLSVVDSLLSKH